MIGDIPNEIAPRILIDHCLSRFELVADGLYAKLNAGEFDEDIEARIELLRSIVMEFPFSPEQEKAEPPKAPKEPDFKPKPKPKKAEPKPEKPPERLVKAREQSYECPMCGRKMTPQGKLKHLVKCCKKAGYTEDECEKSLLVACKVTKHEHMRKTIRDIYAGRMMYGTKPEKPPGAREGPEGLSL